MDIYLWICFGFVFSTVLEFCCLSYLIKQESEKRENQTEKVSEA